MSKLGSLLRDALDISGTVSDKQQWEPVAPILSIPTLAVTTSGGYVCANKSSLLHMPAISAKPSGAAALFQSRLASFLESTVWNSVMTLVLAASLQGSVQAQSLTLEGSIKASATISVVNPSLIINGLDLSRIPFAALPFDKLPLDKLPLDKLPLNTLSFAGMDLSKLKIPPFDDVNVENFSVNVAPSTATSVALGVASFAASMIASAQEKKQWRAVMGQLTAIRQELTQMDGKLTDIALALDHANVQLDRLMYEVGGIPNAVWQVKLKGMLSAIEARSGSYGLFSTYSLKDDLKELEVLILSVANSPTPRDAVPLLTATSLYLSLAAGVDLPQRTRIEVVSRVIASLERVLVSGIERDNSSIELEPRQSIAVQVKRLENRIRAHLPGRAVPHHHLADSVLYIGKEIPLWNLGTAGSDGLRIEISTAKNYGWRPLPVQGTSAVWLGNEYSMTLCLAATVLAKRDLSPEELNSFSPTVLAKRISDFVHPSWNRATVMPMGLVTVSDSAPSFRLETIFIYPRRLGGSNDYAGQLAVSNVGVPIRLLNVGNRNIFRTPSLAVVYPYNVPYSCDYGVGPTLALADSNTLRASVVGQRPLTEFARSMAPRGRDTVMAKVVRAEINRRVANANRELARINELVAIAGTISRGLEHLRRSRDALARN